MFGLSCWQVLTDPIWVYLFGSDTLGSVLSLALPSAIIVVMGEIVPQSVLLPEADTHCHQTAHGIHSPPSPLTTRHRVTLRSARATPSP